MSQNFGNAFLKKPPQKDGAVVPKAPPAPSSRVAPAQKPPSPRQTYSKVFRWRPPKGQTLAPAAVEVIGTFTNWRKVPLTRDGVLDAWHVTLHNLQCSRTHHYMRSEEHTSELQSLTNLVCRLLLEKKKI